MSDDKKQQVQRASNIVSAIGALCMPLVLYGLKCNHDETQAVDRRFGKLEYNLTDIDKRLSLIESTRFKPEDGERIKARSEARDEEHERRLNVVEQTLREIPANLIDRFARVEERMAVIGEDVIEIKERLP